MLVSSFFRKDIQIAPFTILYVSTKCKTNNVFPFHITPFANVIIYSDTTLNG